MNVLAEIQKARKLVEDQKMRLEDFEALIIGLFYGRKPAKVDYYEYIQSAEWKRKAEAAKRAVGYRCQICNRHKSEIVLDAHHRTYERLGKENPQDITVLCRDCHELYETNK